MVCTREGFLSTGKKSIFYKNLQPKKRPGIKDTIEVIDKLEEFDLDGLFSALTGPDANCLSNLGNEDFTIPYAAGFCGVKNRFNDLVQHRIIDHHFDLDFGQEINDVFGAAVKFGMAFLAAKAFCLGNRYPGDPGFLQGICDVIQLEWFYNRFNFFHGLASSSVAGL